MGRADAYLVDADWKFSRQNELQKFWQVNLPYWQYFRRIENRSIGDSATISGDDTDTKTMDSLLFRHTAPDIVRFARSRLRRPPWFVCRFAPQAEEGSSGLWSRCQDIGLGRVVCAAGTTVPEQLQNLIGVSGAALMLFASTGGVSCLRRLPASAGFRLKLIDLLGGFGLGKVWFDRFVQRAALAPGARNAPEAGAGVFPLQVLY